MGLGDAHNDVDAVLTLDARLLQHCVGLADARRGADENFQLAGRAFLALRLRQQGFGRGSLFEIAPLVGHS